MSTMELELEQAEAMVLEDYVDEDGVYELTPEEEKLLDEAEKEPCISADEANRRHRECLNRLAKKYA